MPDFQADVMSHLAHVIGGTVSATDPTFFSGALANAGNGDGSGVAGLLGCYSDAPAGIEALPVGILLPPSFKADLMSQGEEENFDDVTLVVLVAPADTESAINELMPFRDLVPAAFRSHMRAYAMPNTGWCYVSAGESGIHNWGGIDYYAWKFTLSVHRDMAVNYVDGPTS
jgi:hypothetical protein